MGRGHHRTGKGLEAGSGDPTIGEHLGDAYFRKNYWDKALRTYRRVLDLNPGSKEKEGVQKKIKQGPG